MPKITISNQAGKVVSFKLNNENPQTVLALVQSQDIRWMHACGGNGRCTTCRFNTLKGKEKLKTQTPEEQKFIDAGKILPTQRMACQAIVAGDVEVEIPEKCKLPGVNYTN